MQIALDGCDFDMALFQIQEILTRYLDATTNLQERTVAKGVKRTPTAYDERPVLHCSVEFYGVSCTLRFLLQTLLASSLMRWNTQQRLGGAHHPGGRRSCQERAGVQAGCGAWKKRSHYTPRPILFYQITR